MSKEWWFFSVPLCVKSKFQKSYKDIEDEKFQEILDYIEFLKIVDLLARPTRFEPVTLGLEMRGIGHTNDLVLHRFVILQ